MNYFGIPKSWIMNRRINLISGPRNISTALMYAFGNRDDTEVIDEPMYAYYLDYTGVDYHPGTDQILDALPRDFNRVKEEIFFKKLAKPIFFIKGMAHHYVNIDYGFLKKLRNVFLIRNPYQLIASFAKIIEHPTLEDIGLKREWEICNYLIEQGERPIVIDSNVVLSNPKLELEKLCTKLEIPFSPKMLQWEVGPKPYDGVWAKYWYSNVWKSTTFTKQKTSDRKLPERLNDLYTESLKYYNQLKSLAEYSNF